MPRFAAIAALIVATALGPAVADDRAESLFRPPRDEAPLQGHDAEARQRDPAEIARHDRLFAISVPLEEGEPGVSCDHRLARRPETSAGLGAVAVASRGERPIARLWLAPSPDASSDRTALAAAATARLRARLAPADAATAGIEVAVFHWCR